MNEENLLSDEVADRQYRQYVQSLQRATKDHGLNLITYAIANGYEVTEPKRGSNEAAGIDLRVPKFTNQFFRDFNEKNPASLISKDFGYIMGNTIVIPPHNRIIIPTGLRVKLPYGTYLEVANRGGIASLQGLVYGAHIIDSDYQGIVFINLINTSTMPRALEPDQKFIQLIHKECIMSSVLLVKEEDLYTTVTERGEGALGHTDKKS